MEIVHDSLSQFHSLLCLCMLVVKHEIFVDVVIGGHLGILDGQPNGYPLCDVDEVFELYLFAGQIEQGEDAY